jgi:mannan endo-1,4-beta-mannosidase
VDVVSADTYSTAGNHDPQLSLYNRLKSLSGDSKLIALTECGVIPDPNQMLSQGVNWAWWVTWNGDFITGGSHNSRSFLQSTFGASSVLTLDEIQGWKNGGGPSPTTATTARSTTTTTTTTAGGGSGTSPKVRWQSRRF